LPTRGSHRPERAQLTHSVPQVIRSLRLGTWSGSLAGKAPGSAPTAGRTSRLGHATPAVAARATYHHTVAQPLLEKRPQMGICFANRAIRCCRVDTISESDVSVMFPSNGLITRRPASLPRVLGGASSPASSVLSGRYDFLPPISPRFVAFAWRYHSSARVSPARGRALPRAALLELVTRYLLPGGGQWRRQDLLRSWGTPIVLLPCSPTPAGPTHQAMQCVGAAPDLSTTKAPACVLSRLNHTASALAVYASQAGSPRHHARLASGCWPDSSGRA